MKKLIEIDGSFGEGGGQILRSSLSLSMYTQFPVVIKNIRAGRKKPGLMRQHLTAVKAAAEICDARVRGAEISSLKLYFDPAKIKSGNYNFDIGTAGSTTLVLQTVVPVLMLANGESNISLGGGTHNEFSPPVDFLNYSFFNQLRKMGPVVNINIGKFGFFPVGGGKIDVNVKPVKELNQIEIIEKGSQLNRKAIAYSSLIPESIGKSEMKIIQKKLGWNEVNCIAKMVDSPGPGNVIILIDENDNSTETFTGFGRKNYKLKNVIDDVLREYSEYVDADVPVYKYLADQLIIPMALAGGGSFITTEPTLHTMTIIEVVKKFLAINISVDKINEKQYQIRIGDKA
ncbi:MAG: RNA 3'-terminal phosphate cyclase [bacterium]|nr:RNA 3'-terminal phosphate cyclase [bacterium]